MAKNKDEKTKKSGTSPSGKRSKSPGKKKGKGKEVDLQPSSKKDSKLKKRGDVEETFKTIGNVHAKKKAKSFTSLVAHGTGTYLQFLVLSR